MYIHMHMYMWIYTCLHEHGTQILKDTFRLLSWGGSRKEGMWVECETNKQTSVHWHMYSTVYRVDDWWRPTKQRRRKKVQSVWKTDIKLILKMHSNILMHQVKKNTVWVYSYEVPRTDKFIVRKYISGRGRRGYWELLFNGDRVSIWSWNSDTLATWCKELTHLKRPWWWERLRAGGEGDDRGWDGWMASPTQWTWVWVNSGSWWWTGRPGMLQSTGSQRVGYDWVTELNWDIMTCLPLSVPQPYQRVVIVQSRELGFASTKF